MINEGPTFGRFFKLNDLPNALSQPRQIVRAILLPEGGGTLGFFQLRLQKSPVWRIFAYAFTIRF